MEEFVPALSRIAASYARSVHDREDLLQDILLAVWRAMPTFRGEAALRTFVFRIAHNRGLRYVWNLKRHKQFLEQQTDIYPDESPGPFETVAFSEQQEKLLSAVCSLPLSLRQVLTLALEGLSHQDIAQTLGISENNSAVRLHRARDLLKKQVGGKQ